MDNVRQALTAGLLNSKRRWSCQVTRQWIELRYNLEGLAWEVMMWMKIVRNSRPARSHLSTLQSPHQGLRFHLFPGSRPQLHQKHLPRSLRL